MIEEYMRQHGVKRLPTKEPKPEPPEIDPEDLEPINPDAVGTYRRKKHRGSDTQ